MSLKCEPATEPLHIAQRATPKQPGALQRNDMSFLHAGASPHAAASMGQGMPSAAAHAGALHAQQGHHAHQASSLMQTHAAMREMAIHHSMAHAHPSPLLASTPAPPAPSPFDLAAGLPGGSQASAAVYAYQQQLALQRVRASTSAALPGAAQVRGSQVGSQVRGSEGSGAGSTSSPPSSVTFGSAVTGEDPTTPEDVVTPSGVSGSGGGDSARSSATTVPRHGKAPPKMVNTLPFTLHPSPFTLHPSPKYEPSSEPLHISAK